MSNGASSAHHFRPKLVTMLRDGYDLPSLRADAAAGLTVAVVALPLSMAIAEKADFAKLLRHWASASVVLTTFAVTLLFDLTAGIVAGCLLSAAIALFRAPLREQGA